jgi:hypothetical protein
VIATWPVATPWLRGSSASVPQQSSRRTTNCKHSSRLHSPWARFLCRMHTRSPSTRTPIWSISLCRISTAILFCGSWSRTEQSNPLRNLSAIRVLGRRLGRSDGARTRGLLRDRRAKPNAHEPESGYSFSDTVQYCLLELCSRKCFLLTMEGNA